MGQPIWEILAWIYPLTYLFLAVICLVVLQKRGGCLLSFGFFLHFLMGLTYRIQSIFSLYDYGYYVTFQIIGLFFQMLFVLLVLIAIIQIKQQKPKAPPTPPG